MCLTQFQSMTHTNAHAHTHARSHHAGMMDLDYYPKLQGCVPFSPVSGPRLLAMKDGPDNVLGQKGIQKALATALIQLQGVMLLILRVGRLCARCQ